MSEAALIHPTSINVLFLISSWERDEAERSVIKMCFYCRLLFIREQCCSSPRGEREGVARMLRGPQVWTDRSDELLQPTALDYLPTVQFDSMLVCV